jgi:hypothetical protein
MSTQDLKGHHSRFAGYASCDAQRRSRCGRVILTMPLFTGSSSRRRGAS